MMDSSLNSLSSCFSFYISSVYNLTISYIFPSLISLYSLRAELLSFSSVIISFWDLIWLIKAYFSCSCW